MFNQLIRNRSMLIMMSLTLGLAPFFPEPHIWGKLQWVVGGAEGMQPMDWLDFLFHGTPWALLLIHFGISLGEKFGSSKG
ncbi:MAG: hypothetical protein OEX02_21980 [Cyclobacteriaceae bacterium]|nr:hypothetical protein [Cyclobacteriaceae bacterium]